MEHSADVVIVSAFGRGDWLATELAHQGWAVSLVDASDQLGDWSAEDAEGPFGFLEGSDLLASHKTRMMAEGESIEVPEGMVFWLPDGPLELKSEMTTFQLEKRKVLPEVEAYLRRPGLPDREAERERRKLLAKPSEQSWLAGLSHQLASTIYRENHHALEAGFALPVFSNFLIRRVTAAGRMKSLKACQTSGVKVRAHARIRDVRMSGSLYDAIEVQDEHAGVERGRAFVWMLSSAETELCPESIGEALFDGSRIRPEWFWARYSFQLKAPAIAEQIPLWSAVVRDPILPWVHSNLVVLRRERGAGELSAWVRLPMRARFERPYLERMGVEIKGLMQTRLPGGEPELQKLPPEHAFQDAAKGEEKLGPPRIPVYLDEAVAKLKLRGGKNLFFDSPEQWASLDWLGICRHQMMILEKLMKLKAAWDAADRKANGEGGGFGKRFARDPSDRGPRSPST